MNVSPTCCIRKQEEALFRKWKQRHFRKRFVPDGCIQEDAYLGSKPRLLFILKEANETSGDPLDLRDFVADGAQGKTWNNITRWTLGIRRLYAGEGVAPFRWDVMKSVTRKMRVDALRSIAAMNLKKTPGGGRSVDEEIKGVAEQDAELIRAQFELYNPELTVCCGDVTYTALCRALGVGDEPDEWAGDIPWYRHCGGIIVWYFHPQASKSSRSLLHHLLNTINAIRGPNRCP